MKEKCRHKWIEDEMFTCGAITMIAGTPKDMGEETRFICKKCGDVKYKVIQKLGTLLKVCGFGEKRSLKDK